MSSDRVYKIEAIVRPQRIEAIQESLYEIGLHGITISEVRGAGRQRAPGHTFRGSQYSQNLSARQKVEVIVTAEALEEAVQAIVDAAYTGESGDGKVAVTELFQVIRIRTGEKGSAAIT